MTGTLQLTRTFGGITNRGKCHSQFLWPMYIASLIKPDLWIILRQA
jgi:hypothetical protein